MGAFRIVLMKDPK